MILRGSSECDLSAFFVENEVVKRNADTLIYYRLLRTSNLKKLGHKPSCKLQIFMIPKEIILFQIIHVINSSFRDKFLNSIKILRF